jgi:hypothetical protein
VSPKSVANKLLIKPNGAVWTSDAERGRLLEPLPEGARRAESLADATVAIAFADDAASLRRLLAERGRELARPETLWIAYPKGNRADINRDSVWPILSEHGFRPVSQVAIDDVWSALRFRPLREGEAPFTGGR